MKTKFIINPISGSGENKMIELAIKKYVNKDQFLYDIIYTKEKGHAKKITEKCIEEKYDLIIVGGGDGTINEVISEIIFKNIAFGIIPIGSGNGLALHYNYKDPIKCIKNLNSSQIKQIDSGIINNYPFVNVSGIGFDAHIANLFSKRKKRGLFNYIKLIFQEINYRAKKYTINYEDDTQEIDALLIAAANGSQYGNHLKISPKSKTDNGYLDYIIVEDMPKWNILYFLFLMAIGKIESSKFVTIIRCKQMTINTNKNYLHLDGEPKELEGEINIKIIPKSLKIFLPNE